MHGRKRSITPGGISPLQESSSPSHVRRSSLSPVRRGSLRSVRSPMQSPGERTRYFSLLSAFSPQELVLFPAYSWNDFSRYFSCVDIVVIN